MQQLRFKKKWGTQNCKNQLKKIIELKEEDNNGNGPGF